MRTTLANVRKPMVPMNGTVGLLEKRLIATSSLDLDQALAFIGEWDRPTDNDLLLDDEAEVHNNHASDPGANTLNMSDAVTSNWEYARGLTSNLGMTDYVHVTLDGYAPGIDLSNHTVITDDDVVAGQAVFVSASNHVDLATCDPGAGNPDVFALVLVGGLSGETVTVLTEGSVTLPDWTAITGTALLTPGAMYFLDTTPGALTTTAPTTDTYVVTKVGRAVTTTKIDIEIGETVIL